MVRGTVYAAGDPWCMSLMVCHQPLRWRAASWAASVLPPLGSKGLAVEAETLRRGKGHWVSAESRRTRVDWSEGGSNTTSPAVAEQSRLGAAVAPPFRWRRHVSLGVAAASLVAPLLAATAAAIVVGGHRSAYADTQQGRTHSKGPRWPPPRCDHRLYAGSARTPRFPRNRRLKRCMLSSVLRHRFVLFSVAPVYAYRATCDQASTPW